MVMSSKQAYVLYCDRTGSWDKEFEFLASDIKEAKSLAYTWAAMERIGQNRVGVRRNTKNKPLLAIVREKTMA
jgi:hypothetical protein